MQTRSHSIVTAALFFIASLSLITNAVAQEKKVDPTGTWTWSFTTPNGDKINQKLKLKLEGDKLTGAITGQDGNETSIEEPKLKDNELSFQITRERDGNKFTAKYNGKISGDTITGKTENNFGGQTRSRDWEAKRESAKGKESSGANVTGHWKYTLTTAGGQTFEPTLKLKQEGDKVTGVVIFNQNEAPISDGQSKDGEVSFKVQRERDGQTFVTKYQGKLDGDAIKGKINSNWGGSERTYEFEAKRTKE